MRGVSKMEWEQELQIASMSKQIDAQYKEITSLRKTLGETLGDLAQARAAVVRLPHLGKVS